ncbi:hypothetical protein HYV79_05160 [Candidatus Woesearchaeota archaeon]|nr:hypothetical protein [Candidatus Woesearchaeota archaeon]
MYKKGDKLVSIEVNEVIILLLILIGYIPVIHAYFKYKSTITWFFLGYTTLLIGSIATILETFFYPVLLNYVEHLIGTLLSALLFLTNAYLSNKQIVLFEKELTKKIKKFKKNDI